MLVVGGLMVFWALARPVMPEPESTRGEGSGRIPRAPATWGFVHDARARRAAGVCNGRARVQPPAHAPKRRVPPWPQIRGRRALVPPRPSVVARVPARARVLPSVRLRRPSRSPPRCRRPPSPVHAAGRSRARITRAPRGRPPASRSSSWSNGSSANGAVHAMTDTIGSAAQKATTPIIAGGAAAAGLIGGMVLGRRVLGPRRTVLGIPVSRKGLSLQPVAKEVQKAGQQLGRLTDELARLASRPRRSATRSPDAMATTQQRTRSDNGSAVTAQRLPRPAIAGGAAAAGLAAGTALGAILRAQRRPRLMGLPLPRGRTRRARGRPPAPGSGCTRCRPTSTCCASRLSRRAASRPSRSCSPG